jgi:hypothetical protein
MNAQRFREDNTEGYSASELAELNRLFEQAKADVEYDENDGASWLDRIAEAVQATFDDER